MNLLQLFGFGKKNKKNYEKSIAQTKEENQQKMIGLLNVREEYTNEMFSAIKKYTENRDQLIKKSITERNNISEEQGVEIINDFIENIAENIPQGVLVPIKTSFVYRGKSQILFIGNKILTSGKCIKENGTKPRQSLKEKGLIGFFIDFDSELNIFDSNKNSKIYLSKEKRSKIIQLTNEKLIDSKTVNCRVANLEFIFDNWEDSLESVVSVKDIDLIDELLEYLISLDYEVATGVTDFFNKKNNEVSEESSQESLEEVLESENNNEIE